MNNDEKALLAEAVNMLISDTDAQSLYKQLMGVYDLARKDFPVRLTGRAATLNPLLELMLSDYEASVRVRQLIEDKRNLVGMPSLDDPEQVRRDYMRELMATRRERLRRLVELWNSMRPEREKLRGNARMEFERLHGNRWFAARDDREQTLRERLGRRLTQQERTEMLEAFWNEVNSELDDLEEFARNQMKAGAQRTNVFQFKIQPRKDDNERT